MYMYMCMCMRLEWKACICSSVYAYICNVRMCGCQRRQDEALMCLTTRSLLIPMQPCLYACVHVACVRMLHVCACIIGFDDTHMHAAVRLRGVVAHTIAA